MSDTYRSLVLTFAGADRPGLVDLLSKTVLAHQGNWEESRMANLAGQFVGILRLTIPEASNDALQTALVALAKDGLDVTVVGARAVQPRAQYNQLRLELTGNDRVGIVHDISHILARHGVNVEDLSTECVSAPVSGGLLFKATARLRCPAEISADDLRNALEELANELMVDITDDDDDGA